MAFGLSELEIIAHKAVGRILDHQRKHDDMCINCPIILTRREYFFTKRYLQKTFNVKTHSKLKSLYGVRILRDDQI